MAINTNPLFTAGQNLTADQLSALLSGQYSGKFAPTLSQAGVDWVNPGGGLDPYASRTVDYIHQPRNVSSWGGNDTADVWDAQGNYLGTSSGATDLRNLARMAALSAGAYYGAAGLNEATAGGAAAGGSTMPVSTTTLGADALAQPAITFSDLGTIPGAVGGGSSSLMPLTTTALDVSTLAPVQFGALTPEAVVGSGWSVSPAVSAAAGGAAGSAAGGGGGSATKAAMYGAEGYGPGMTGAQTGAFDATLGATGSTTAAKLASDLVGGASSLGLNGGTLASLAGALAGAADSGDKTASSNRDPWAPIQPYLKAIAADGAPLYDRYKAQPFNAAQQTAYGNIGGLLDSMNANAPGLLASFQQMAANPFVRGKQASPPPPSSMGLMAGWAPGSYGNFGTRG